MSYNEPDLLTGFTGNHMSPKLPEFKLTRLSRESSGLEEGLAAKRQGRFHWQPYAP